MIRYRTLFSLILLFIFGLNTGLAQNHPRQEATFKDRPKLVVGIVVDQMRYDYLPRYWDNFGAGGFKRLITQRYNVKNRHYNYLPTYPGPGPAAIYPGTTPSVNGIVGNSWYDRSIDKKMYVVSDTTATPVGIDADKEAGQMSPANLLSTTVTDALKNADKNSKVIAVSIKDRASVLPGGHLADGAYWYDGESGNFISSSWYMDVLPQWVRNFNEEGLAKELSQKTWNTLLPIDEYEESNPDDSPYEGAYGWEEVPTFPHELAKSGRESYGIISASPFGNTLVKELAKQALDAEDLGTNEATDFLSISFSSTDYIGHQFGPHSIEVQDTYLRLDRDLADLLNYLDQKVGQGNYMVMLTSDHGAVDVPAELMDKKLPGGYFNSGNVIKALKQYMHEQYGKEEWIEAYTNQQVYLDRELIKAEGMVLQEVQDDVANFLRHFDAIKSTNTAHNLQYENYTEDYQAMYQRGFLFDRSGDVYIQLKPGYLGSSSHTGTSHGSPYTYDTHVPLLFYGWNVPQGETSRKTFIPQIAPTIATMLGIPLPSGTPANVLLISE